MGTRLLLEEIPLMRSFWKRFAQLHSCDFRVVWMIIPQPQNLRGKTLYCWNALDEALQRYTFRQCQWVCWNVIAQSVSEFARLIHNAWSGESVCVPFTQISRCHVVGDAKWPTGFPEDNQKTWGSLLGCYCWLISCHCVCSVRRDRDVNEWSAEFTWIWSDYFEHEAQPCSSDLCNLRSPSSLCLVLFQTINALEQALRTRAVELK